MIKNNYDIALLLACYNGEKYMREQLESLYGQTFKDWTLFVRDDGSTDSTMDIIKEYQAQYSNIVVIDNNGKRLGARDNFMALLENVDSQYYMFVDEDDVWLPNKIRNEYEKIKMLDTNKPALVITNLKLVDGNLNVISESFWKSIKFDYRVFNSFRYQSYMCYVTGCTMLFNQKAKAVSFPMPSYAPMHDWWVAVSVYKYGGNLGFIEEPQMLYRKHGDNATGDFVESQREKTMSLRFKESVDQYLLMKKCGCVKTPFDYLYLKYHVKILRERCR